MRTSLLISSTTVKQHDCACQKYHKSHHRDVTEFWQHSKAR